MEVVDTRRSIRSCTAATSPSVSWRGARRGGGAARVGGRRRARPRRAGGGVGARTGSSTAPLVRRGGGGRAQEMLAPTCLPSSPTTLTVKLTWPSSLLRGGARGADARQSGRPSQRCSHFGSTHRRRCASQRARMAQAAPHAAGRPARPARAAGDSSAWTPVDCFEVLHPARPWGSRALKRLASLGSVKGNAAPSHPVLPRTLRGGPPTLASPAPAFPAHL
jgi:hypothetical protein